MWSVGCITGLIVLVNISAGVHLRDVGGKRDRVVLQDQVQLPGNQAHAIKPELKKHEFIKSPQLDVKSTSDLKKKPVRRNMRIHVHYDTDSVPQLPAATRDLIKNVLMKEAVEYFKKTLKVRNVITPLRLVRDCKDGWLSMVDDDPTVFCEFKCKKKSVCGEATIPKEHLKGCQWLYKKKWPPRGIREKHLGPGVDADFILYVTAKNSTICDRLQTMAYAAHCQQEVELDRPLAGNINFCPDHKALSDDPRLLHAAIMRVKHEIIHALAFSADLYAYYRDKYGKPMSARTPFGWPYISREKTVWSARTIRKYDRRKWKTVVMIVTPAVVREVRKHFGCYSLEGAELEDQGGDGVEGIHWEKRVFGNEAMTGMVVPNSAISRVTLALLEDSGWYLVNYKMAEPLYYGYKKGCKFVKLSCSEYIALKKLQLQDIEPFCDFPGSKNMDMFTCLPGATSVSYCNLLKYPRWVLPYEYKLFTKIDGVKDEDVHLYGGRVALADYCPFWEIYSQNIDSRRMGDSQCQIPENQLGEKVNTLRETFSAESKCFNYAEPWLLWTDSTTFKYSTIGGAGCYRIKCGKTKVDGFKVYVDANEFECKAEGHMIAVFSNPPRAGSYNYSGVLTCPSYKLVCEKQHAPHSRSDAEAWNPKPPTTPKPRRKTEYGAGRAHHSASGDIIVAEISDASALCHCWAIVIGAVLVQMTLSSCLQLY